MEYSNKNIVINELIGLKARVVSCSDRRQRGITGLVIDETRNTLLLETRKGERKIIKQNSEFRFYSGRKSFLVKGREINFRPEERTEKAMKFYRKRV